MEPRRNHVMPRLAASSNGHSGVRHRDGGQKRLDQSRMQGDLLSSSTRCLPQSWSSGTATNRPHGSAVSHRSRAGRTQPRADRVVVDVVGRGSKRHPPRPAAAMSQSHEAKASRWQLARATQDLAPSHWPRLLAARSSPVGFTSRRADTRRPLKPPAYGPRLQQQSLQRRVPRLTWHRREDRREARAAPKARCRAHSHQATGRRNG